MVTKWLLFLFLTAVTPVSIDGRQLTDIATTEDESELFRSSSEDISHDRNLRPKSTKNTKAGEVIVVDVDDFSSTKAFKASKSTKHYVGAPAHAPSFYASPAAPSAQSPSFYASPAAETQTKRLKSTKATKHGSAPSMKASKGKRA
ncbi:hypothetical protein IV203_014646 [Nitzschia inconspicua]|uniref:Uncharacterized protein n=1 Tax=Nitzschia inconspicua TaxID=303405 RepID=A0A9K3LA81_9STRA|nr:hypothetical protein IV203_018979 [Nitzschia inconspicua]KAG7358059.1 hypothetical protein IV203_014646 [Nitzschia inconspicua]